jgi:hypothetical protein
MTENVVSGQTYSETRPNSWLNEFARNITSQHGEDGIIEKVLELIKDNDKWCVEFGSWDGKKCSNTFNLINAKDYSAVLIEGDLRRFKDLSETYKGNHKVILKNIFVGFGEQDGLTTGIPVDFDLLSIDIDGNDYHVWHDVRHYKPKVVVIEFNPTIPSEVEFVQPRDMRVTQGSSLLSIAKLAKQKGYELVATTRSNAVLVDSRYYGLFGIRDNSAGVMRADKSLITHIFSGFDGTVFVRGCCELPWQNIRYRQAKVQQLPKWARKRVGDRNLLRRKLGKFYRRLRKKGVT